MIRQVLNKIVRLISTSSTGPHQSLITIQSNSNVVKGRVLFSFFIIDPFKTDEKFAQHSNIWECAQMIKILSEMGYTVDVIDFRTHPMNFNHDYDVIVDIDINLQLYAPLFENAIKIMHITTGYGRFLNTQELKRVEALEKRRGMRYSPKRLVHYLELFDRSLEVADKCSLIGNLVTKNTFPEHLHDKIVPVTVSASSLNFIKSSDQYLPEEREFIWFFGLGAVTKGLDLLLEIFPKNPQYTLNIVGNLDAEPDFMKIYKNELTNYSNIKYHGAMSPLSDEFVSIVKRCFCFLAPTCSEGLSPAVATMMQIGLYPVISRNSGADLPNNTGIFLKEISIEEIDAKIKEVYNKNDNELVNEINEIQQIALKKYSREQYSTEIKDFFADALK